MESLQVGDRVTFKHAASAPDMIKGDEIGVVINVHQTPGDAHNIVDVRFPDPAGLVVGRSEGDYEVVLHHGTRSTA
ncbi:MAG: hypothetical protein IT538_15875 [Variibacter sp.]|nr:hypothetical protein [Variibacter sp.]